MSAAKAKKQKNGVVLAVFLIVIYVVVLFVSLKYTGVIKFPSDKKKTNVANEKVDRKDKSRTADQTAKAAEETTGKTKTSVTSTTSTTLAQATTTTLAVPTDQPDGQDKLQKLVKIYEDMDSDQAAKIIAKLSDSEAISVLSEMKAANAAEVLAAMDVERAAALSRKLGLQSAQ